MKLIEIDSNKYDDLAFSEPNASFYHTSNWIEYMKKDNQTVLYVGYFDDRNVCEALAAIIISKGSFLKRKTATCPFGFLVNYYDNQLLSDFTLDIKQYLSEKGVVTLTINPNIEYFTYKGNNDLLIKNLNDLGYKRISDNYIFKKELKRSRRKQTNDNDLIVYEVNTSEQLNKVFKLNSDYKKLYDKMNDYVKFVVCESNNPEDNNNIISLTCLITFKQNVTQLFTYENPNYKTYDSLDTLNKKAEEILLQLGFKSYNSNVQTQNSIKNDFIGEFELSIK